MTWIFIEVDSSPFSHITASRQRQPSVTESFVSFSLLTGSSWRQRASDRHCNVITRIIVRITHAILSNRHQPALQTTRPFSTVVHDGCSVATRTENPAAIAVRL